MICVLLLAAMFAGDTNAIDNAVAALERGDAPTAEQILNADLREHPGDVAATELMAVVLDQEKKFSDADAMYRRALRIDPHSPALLNNYGNHLLGIGKQQQAQQAFDEVISLDPAHVNARVQLARIAIESKKPLQALEYLGKLPPAAKSRTDIATLRMQAEFASGHADRGEALLERLSSQDPNQNVAVATALSAVGQYSKAEALFGKALAAQPSNFQALYDLGLAASHAGHNERAREVLQRALDQQPQNPDVLYDLSAVDMTLNQREAALELLAKAHAIAPERADIDALLARASASVGYFADSAKAWTEFLKLKPNDDAARRDYAFTETAVGQNVQSAIAELKEYVRLHPRDPTGYYELGVAQASTVPDTARQLFDRAISIDPKFVPARFARGLLMYRAGQIPAALADFKICAEAEPASPVMLDRLGQTYAASGQFADALPLLRKAAALDPHNPTILLHLGHTLSESDQKDEAAAVFAQYRELGPAKSELPRPPGLLDFLTLSPAEQQARYRAGLERTLKAEPNNVEALVRYLSVLLQLHEFTPAADVVNKLEHLSPDVSTTRRAASALIDARQFTTAEHFLRLTLPAASPPSDLQVDLAIATLHVTGPGLALQIMDRIPAASRNGEYELALAQILEASGDTRAANAAINEALHSAGIQPDIYRRAAVLLMGVDHIAQAQELLRTAAAKKPDDPRTQLAYALALALGHQNTDRQFRTIEDRWPEWIEAWVGHALALDANSEQEAARTKVETALDLSHDSAAAYYCLAAIDLHSSPPDRAGALNAARRAASLRPESTAIRSLADSLTSTDPRPPSAPETLTAGAQLVLE